MRITERWWLGLAGGFLLGLALTPWPLGFLGWVAYVPLLFVLMTSAPRRVAATALAVHLIGYLIAGHWVLLHPLGETALVSAAGLLSLAAIASLPWAGAAMMAPEQSGLRLVALTAGVLTVETAHLHSELGFPWLLLGHTQSALEPFNQLVDVGGVTGLTLWLLGLNILGFLILARPPRQTALVVAWVMLVFGAAAYGGWSLMRYNGDDERDRLRLLAVQTSLDPEIWADVESTTRVDSLLTTTADALNAAGEQPDLIIWPETVLPPEMIASGAFQSTVDSLRVPLLAGAIEVLESTVDGVEYANSAILFEPGKLEPAVYRKQRLVPFAEYVPYSSNFRWLTRFSAPAGGVAAYRPGKESDVLSLADVKMGVMICLESTMGYLARETARSNADILVILTQNGWWGDTFGYRQHLQIGRLRAIETRRPVIQVAATGISAHIDASGGIRSSLGWMEPVAGRWTVGLGSGSTLYLLLGDWPGWLGVIMVVVLILRAALKRQRR